MSKMRWIVLIALLASTDSPLKATTQPLSFARRDYASVAGARGIVVGDFDRNGWPDVAQANTGRNTVTILLNHDGTLAKASEIPVGLGPFAIASGDFNTDGILDLVVTNADNDTVTILNGHADGSFAKLIDLHVGNVHSPRGIAVADLNGDGTADLAITGYTSNALVLYLGDGHNGFRLGTTFFGNPVQPQGAAVGDLNRDGRADVVVAGDSTGGLAVLFGHAAPDVLAPATLVPGAPFLNVVSIADLNSDGWPDVAAASTRNSRVAVFLGGPSGLTFNHSYATGSSPRGITIADVNQDGALDLMTADFASSTVSVLLGNRSTPGTFEAAALVASGGGSRALAAADFDQDGRIDLATGNQNAAVTTVLSNATIFGTAGFSFNSSVLGTPSSTSGGRNDAFPADFNGDGKLDLVTRAPFVPGATPGASVIMTGGAAMTLVGPEPFFPDRILVTDATADGRPDVIIEICTNDGLDLITQIGDGHGGFTVSPHTRSSIRACTVATGDFNGDAFPDLAVVGFDPAVNSWVVRTMLGNGNGTFHAGGSVAVSNVFRAMMTVADVNRDGHADAIVSQNNQALEIWLGTGAGGFLPGPILLPLTLNNGLRSVQVADLNHDGYPDIVAGGEREVAVLLSDHGAFPGPAILPAVDSNDQGVGAFEALSLGDLNMDGNLDIVTDLGAVFSGLGDGTFSAPALFDVGFDSAGVRVADFNRDGLPDVLVGAAWGSVRVLLNTRNEINHPPTVNAGPDLTFNYQDQFGIEDTVSIGAVGRDPDAHALRYQWKDQNGKILSTFGGFELPVNRPGTYTFTVTVFDGRGGTATDSMKVTVTPTKEIVLYGPFNGEPFGDKWVKVSDSTAADGVRMYNPNANAPKVTAVNPNPASFVTLPFIADPTQTYKLWVRLKADSNGFANDSIWVQFSGSVNVAGSPAYRLGTTSGLEVNLEECSGCGISGWGWEDDGWGAVNKNGTTLRFPDGGRQVIRIQQREDGVSFDQIVLSSETYLTKRPGLAKNDHTILPRTFFPPD
jgi:VCBS repeat protein/FG-GAP repeat protein